MNDKYIDFNNDNNLNASVFNVKINEFLIFDFLRLLSVKSNVYSQDEIYCFFPNLYLILLDSVQIVPYIPPKQHPISAEVLPES